MSLIHKVFKAIPLVQLRFQSGPETDDKTRVIASLMPIPHIIATEHHDSLVRRELVIAHNP